METTTQALIFFAILGVLVTPFILNDVKQLFTPTHDTDHMTEEEYAHILPTLRQMKEDTNK